MNPIRAIFLCLFSLLFQAQAFCYQYELGICAIFQNEGPYLKEWIEFHKLQGVQHFYLFNNRSEDNANEILAPYVRSGEVTLIRWPHYPQVYAQYAAYDYCLTLASGRFKWLAYIDLDEYLFTTSGESLRDYLKPFEDIPGVAGVCVNWQMYGTSGVEQLKEKELLIEKLLLKAPRDYHANHHIKSIIRPECAIQNNTPHCFIYKPGYCALDPDFNICTNAFNSKVPIDEIRINHYYCKTADFAYGEKVERLMKCHGWSREGAQVVVETYDQECSIEEDRAILIYQNKLRRTMGY